jgi:16S rRNA processing protein RimM
MSGSDRLLVGRVARAHGNKGQVIVNPETDFPEQRFRRGQVLLVGLEPRPVPRAIREVRFQQGRPIVALDGIETMNDAEALAGAGLWVEAGSVGPLPENTFYHHDLVGCEVVDRSGAPVGTVTAVEGPMERSQLVVQGPHGEVLIPLAAEIVEVDLTAKRVIVDPPEGLLELNETGRSTTHAGASGASAARVEWRRPATARSRRGARENRAREGGK